MLAHTTKKRPPLLEAFFISHHERFVITSERQLARDLQFMSTE